MNEKNKNLPASTKYETLFQNLLALIFDFKVYSKTIKEYIQSEWNRRTNYFVKGILFLFFSIFLVFFFLYFLFHSLFQFIYELSGSQFLGYFLMTWISFFLLFIFIYLSIDNLQKIVSSNHRK